MNEAVSTRPHLPLTDSIEEPAFVLAVDCGRLFERHLDVEVPAESNDTRQLIEEYQRLFWKWAHYVGVFAAGKASLDWRLRHNKMYLELFLLALDMLKANLHQMLPPDSRSATSAGSDSSDESDAYRAACDGVEESISQLNSLGISIRQPMTSRLHSKVKEFSTKREVQLNDFETLASFALERLYPDAAPSLLQRLIKHMVGIHARLLYWKSHADKLSTQREGQQRSRVQEEPENPEARSVVVDQPSPRHILPGDKHKKRQTISDTEATTLAPQFQSLARKRIDDGKGIKGGTTPTVMTSKIDFPSPPTAEDGHVCWYCRKVHSSNEYISNPWWRSHVNGDLLPYFCLSNHCIGPRTFSSSGEWSSHMTSQHGNDWALNIHESPVLKCDRIGSSHQQSLYFRTLDTFADHARNDHNFEKGTTIAEKTDEDVISSCLLVACPLCYMTVPRESTVKFQATTTEVSNDPDCSFKVKGGAVNEGAKVRFAGDVEAVVYGETEDKSVQHQTCPDDTHLNINRTLSGHIAEHLQRLALLTLRLKVEAADDDDLTEFESDKPAADKNISASPTSTVQQLMNEPSETEMEIASDGVEVRTNDMFLFYGRLPRLSGSLLQERLGNSNMYTWADQSLQTRSQGSPNSELPLPTRLKDAVVQCAYDTDLEFLPKDALDSIVTAESVENYIATSEDPTLRDRCSDIIKFICDKPDRDATGIFAVLLLIEHPQLIVDFMEENINDSDLPLWRRGNETKYIAGYYLDRELGDDFIPIRLFDKWGTVQRFAFFKHQWWVKLPVFEEHNSNSLNSHPVIRLHNSTILPWTEHKPIYHKNSEVVRVRIHHAHHTFQPEENESFAIKTVKSDVVAFQLEVKALLKIKNRKHLVKLLTTYQHQNQYHLIFRWAEGGNLADLWNKHIREPKIDHNRICWLAEQCYGLAYGLDGIHDTRLSGEEVEDIQQSPLSTSYKLAPRTKHPTIKYANASQDEECGRHGDIKPENVLWFSQDANRFKHGVLKISDFGLTTFHSARSTKVSPRGIAVTHTYMAPEYDLNEDLSRPFDIWSLGCTYLEFITWILLGADGLELFFESRLRETGTNKNFVCDNFYKIVRDGKERRAEVKLSVEMWMDKLQQHPACSEFLSDFLDYIRRSMMVLDKSERSGVKQVTMWLRSRYETCLKDEAYALRLPVFQGPPDNPGNPKRKRNLDGTDEHPLKRSLESQV